MKKLYLIRHAKSDWSNSAGIKDIDRPLNNRGISSAYDMAALLKKRNIMPDTILSSDGIRALHTAVVFAHQIGFDSRKVVIIPELFHASSDVLLAELAKIPDTINSVMLFGHNPGISEFASFVDKHNYIKVPTCTIVECDLTLDNWSLIDFEHLQINRVETPKH